MDYQELKDNREEAIRRLTNEAEHMEEQLRDVNVCVQLLKASDGLYSQIDDLREEVARQEREIGELEEQLEQKDSEIEALKRELLEEKNHRLESENHDLAVEVITKPLEIHNHFEPGSNSQVFNDKVKGKFSKNRKINKEKREKKRWKGIVRKML